MVPFSILVEQAESLAWRSADDDISLRNAVFSNPFFDIRYNAMLAKVGIVCSDSRLIIVQSQDTFKMSAIFPLHEAAG